MSVHLYLEKNPGLVVSCHLADGFNELVTAWLIVGLRKMLLCNVPWNFSCDYFIYSNHGDFVSFILFADRKFSDFSEMWNYNLSIRYPVSLKRGYVVSEESETLYCYYCRGLLKMLLRLCLAAQTIILPNFQGRKLVCLMKNCANNPHIIM